MKWDIVFPAIVFYVEDVGDGFAGKANAFIVRIKERYKDDKGLLVHEVVHVKQWFMTLGLHSILYKFFKGYRYLAEIKAYRKQLVYADNVSASARHFASFLSKKYDLDVSTEEALKDLQK